MYLQTLLERETTQRRKLRGLPYIRHAEGLIRKSKEYIYNYVDRVRFAESSFPDYKCPSRGSGWRHNKSVSHLDLATSCHSAASGLNHWSSSHQSSRHQLRHSRSLDYNHIDRCKDALDIAEYYWRLDHDPEVYDEEEEVDIEPEHTGGSQLKYVSEHHHYRDFKCGDENYHHSANNNGNNSNNNIYQSSTGQQQQQPQQQKPPNNRQSSTLQQHHQPAVVTAAAGATGAVPAQAFEFASDSCSLRRSRSLAVIREETFSDLQISSSNGSRRSQLIPRARLVNRGYFRERDRLIYSNNKHHHHHHASREKLANCSGSGSVSGSIGTGAVSTAPSVDADEQSNESLAETCDSHQHQHQQQLQHYQQQQQHHQQQQKSHNQSQSQQHQHQQHLHYHPQYHDPQQQPQTATATNATTVANDYYDHLKRLDKLALGLVAEQLHPWHNDKSDLESLNSDYFKNSLHQSHELKQQHFEIEALEQAVNLLTQDKPRIYQSRRQKHHNADNNHKQPHSAGASGGESCPENSQSSVFPETTTSNSDDQSDSGSLSEQEYDITKIEEIYQKTHIEGDADSYEIISLTTTTRTRFESTGDECENDAEYDSNHLDECDYNLDESQEEEDHHAEESNQHTTTDTEVEGTLKRSRAVSDNLQKIIAYDSVYLSSEESSDSTLVDTDHCDTSLEVTSLRTCIDEVETVLHISIEDAIYEPKAKQNKLELELEDHHEPIGFVETVNTKIEILEEDSCDDLDPEENSPLYTQILKVEHTPSSVVPHSHSVITTAPAVGVTSSAASKPKILSVVEKRKLKRYSDSAYSSNVSDSSDRTHGSYPSNESSAYSHHLKRQVAEPLYIPLRSNLSENQYHSLPDVNIGQILKVSESIDAQLRSCYNLDNYRSLDDTPPTEESNLGETVEISGAVECHATDNHYFTNSNNHNTTNRIKKREEVVTSEQIYDSIKRFGRAHQRYRQKEIKECQQQQQQHQQQQQQQPNHHPRVQSNKCLEPNLDADVEPKDNSLDLQKQADLSLSQENHTEAGISTEDYKQINAKEESYLLAEEQPDLAETFCGKPLEDITASLSDQYDSFEKSKEAPAITVENFSQLIERRAKEIRQSGRRNKQQQIEFAHRAKFRLENTLASYSETEETKAPATYQSKKAVPASTFRIVVTDAQNNIIEEDSIESQENYRSPSRINQEEEKENLNFINLQEKIDQSANDLQFVKFNKERLKGRTSPLSSTSNRQSSLKRVPSKPKRQLYPTCNHNLSSAETKKFLLSPKSKERRVLSNQIYRARPVKVITATDSFRRNKVKQASSKMSRPQILQVIDNKRKSHGNATSSSSSISTCNPTSACNHSEGNQVENEYLKKVDAVRCYWSKLVNEEEEAAAEERQPQQADVEAQEENITTPVVKSEQQSLSPHQEKDQISKTTTNMEMENTPPTSTPAPNTSHHVPEKRHFILGAQNSNATANAQVGLITKQPAAPPVPADTKAVAHNNPDDYCSFMPSIEIVELDGDKKATIVSAVPSNATADDTLDATEPQFDHIRYKVMKSQQLLRSNVLARNTKEAQFDGLIQYLQEYSFQELLSNNNVVIVEPVRTKIERPLASSSSSSAFYASSPNQYMKNTKDKTTSGLSKQKTQGTGSEVSASCNEDIGRNKLRTNSTSSSAVGGAAVGSGIKRHFFYQPVQVNRELYEEELPNPDTVRNVRKFFEEHILPTPGQGLLTTALVTTTSTGTGAATITTTTTTTATLTKASHNGMLAKQTSPKSRRTRKYRYLTIDTSYGHAATTATSKFHHQRQQQQQREEKNKNSQQSRKWDTASLSSGVSSGDLSSPCECNEAEANANHPPSTNAHCDDSSLTTGPTKSSPDGKYEGHTAVQGVHVQDIVRQHNSSSVKKSRTSAIGIPVRSSSVRTRNAIQGAAAYATLHKKSGKPNIYRNIYEYHAIRRQLQQDSDDQEAAADEDEDDDDDDLFGDVEDDENELCDTYYVSNDVLRKIRECGSSVTYYGGRVVQTSSASSGAAKPKTLESHSGSSNNGLTAVNSFGNNISAAAAGATVTLHNPTMLSQTQTRARVREIETCSNAACQPANECLHKNSSTNRLLQQRKIHLTKNDNQQNKALATVATETTAKPQQLNHSPATKPQGHQQTTNTTAALASSSEDSNKASNNSSVAGGLGSGITFKLVKSNSCSSRLELAGTDADILEHDEPEETEVVRKMVHHFEAGSKHRPAGTEAALTINNQTPIALDDQRTEPSAKPVTVNNHINVPDGILTHSTNDASTKHENGTKEDDGEEPKTFQSEAKDIHLDNSRNGGNEAANAKVCRNKNVDLAFTLVKQQTVKSPGIKEQEMTKNHKLSKTTNGGNPPANFMGRQETKCVTYENTLLPTITATSTVKDAQHKLSMGDFKADEEPLPSQIPEQIIVPIEIHRSGTGDSFHHSSASKLCNKSTEERSFLPLSTASSVTSVIDKSMVKHYVANDRSIYEKRKYDEIEFEEFEVYDPTKDFEKLIEEEEAKRASNAMEEQPAANASNSSSMKTAKSQQSSGSAETETDCYDSLDDKL